MRKRPFVETLVPAVTARSFSYLGPGVLTVASAFALFGIAPPATLPVPLRDTRTRFPNVQTPDPLPRRTRGGRGRSIGETGACIFFAEWSARWLRMVLAPASPSLNGRP